MCVAFIQISFRVGNCIANIRVLLKARMIPSLLNGEMQADGTKVVGISTLRTVSRRERMIRKKELAPTRKWPHT